MILTIVHHGAPLGIIGNHWASLGIVHIITQVSSLLQVQCPQKYCHGHNNLTIGSNGCGLCRELLDLPNETRRFGMPSQRYQH